MGGTAKIGIVGALNSFIQNQRLDGFKKAVTDSGLAITFLDTVDGQNVQETAMSASENLMTANPDMTTLYATGEPALLGAVSAVTSQGRTGDVKVFGWDLTKQVIQGIDDGWVAAVVQQDPAGEGKAAVEALTKLKKGETVEPIINIPVTIVTKDNVEQYRAMFQ
jgi:ribose transport system substrate-binding protein